MAENQHHMSLGVVSFGLAVGITCAIFVLVLGVAATALGWGLQLAAALSSVFIGYGPTFIGAIAGAVWAFADGLIAGVLIAWFYNRILLRRRKTLM